MKREWSGRVIFITPYMDAVQPIVECLRARQPSIRIFLSDGSNIGSPECDLFLADTSKIARLLSNAGLAVVGYEHDVSAGQDFSFLTYVVTKPEELEKNDFQFIWNRITDSPCDILETRRLKVRETTVDDVDVFYELYREPEITKYMESLFEDPEEERVYQEAYIKNIYGLYGYGVWTVIEKASGRIIGRAGVAPREGFEEPELGFMIGKAWQGKGYAYEVCDAVLSYAFKTLQITSVIAVVHEQNKVSQALCKKLGFSDTGKKIVKNHQILMLKLSDFYTEMH